MTDYLSIILNAGFTGFGVAIGNEAYSYFKDKRIKLREHIKGKANG